MIDAIDPFYVDRPDLFHCPSRILPDGRVIRVHRMLFNARITISHTIFADWYVDGWCYHDRDLAVRIATSWDGHGSPRGWNKHPHSGRYRTEEEARVDFDETMRR